MRKPPSIQDKRLTEDLNLYVANILESFLAIERRLNEIRVHQQNDEVCRKIQEFCTDGGPKKQKLNTVVRAYWPHRVNITVQRGLSSLHPYAWTSWTRYTQESANAVKEHANRYGGRASANKSKNWFLRAQHVANTKKTTLNR